MPGTMSAIFYLGPQRLELREAPIPEPGPGEVVVKIEVTLTCGTDLKAYKRGHRLFKPGAIFGHEFAGYISAVGAGVTRWREGDPVVAANSAPCNACFYCRRGRWELCENLSARFNWGAFADYFRIPAHIVEQNMHRIPARLPFREAALVEPLACAVLAVNSAAIEPGDAVAIIGAGAQGLMQIQLARAHGAAQVIAVGRSYRRLTQAAQLGATATISTLDMDAVTHVKMLTGGRGADVVIEAAGSAETWQMATAMARPGGAVVEFSGLPGGAQVTFDAAHIHYDEITIKGVFHHTPRTVEQALHLLSSGLVRGASFIEGEIPLSQVEEGLQRMDRSEVIKLAVLPSLG